MIFERDAYEIADSIRAEELSSVEVLEHYLLRIEHLDPQLNAICDIDVERARDQARAVDSRIAAGDDPGPWAGVPMGVKELASARGLSATHGSLLYAGERADHDDSEVARLRAAGAVIVAKTTSPEFGSVNWTRTHIHGTTCNPWDVERTPGGSSGGSAAAVASGMLPICTGSDGGGSIRIPSAYSGLFGYKSTFGLTGSAPGPFDSSLTAVPGPVARSVRDAARYIDVIAGPTNVDPTSLAKPAPFEPQLLDGTAVAALRGRRAAWSATLGHAIAEPDIVAAARAAAVALCDDAGIELVDIDVSMPNPARAWGILSGLAMAADHGERAAGRLDELTPVVRAGIEYSARIKADDVVRALRRRADTLAAIGAVFDQVHYLLTPTVATLAFAAGGPPPRIIAGVDGGGMGTVPFTAPFNVSGQPAVSIPCGFSVDTTGDHESQPLPIGLQVVGRRHDDIGVLACGLVAERARPWPKLAPMATR